MNIEKVKLPPSTLDMLRKLQASLPEYDVQPVTGMHYDAQSKYVTWKFDPKKFTHIEILHLTDLQFGHVCCNVKEMVKYRDWVLSSPNRFVVLGGDLIDAANVLSPGSP